MVVVAIEAEFRPGANKDDVVVVPVCVHCEVAIAQSNGVLVAHNVEISCQSCVFLVLVVTANVHRKNKYNYQSFQ